MKICIDAGHGFNRSTNKGDTGAINGDLWECTATLAVAKILRDKLKAAGHDVIMTREDDTFISLGERCRICNSADCDVFMSIHCNSAENKNARGIETWKCTGSDNPYAVNIQKRLIEATGAKDRGVKDGTFYVLKSTKCKALLIEIGFISHEEEKNLLFDTSYQIKVAEAIVQGLTDN